MDSPVSADWSSTAMPSATVPSTGTTSPLRTNEPIARLDRLESTSSSLPLRCRMAVRGTRASSAVISRLARRSAKLSRYCPPEYISARRRPRPGIRRTDQGREHRERGDDVQADIAAAQADDDLDQEDDQHRHRGRSPYRAGPMLPSKEMRNDSENQPGRGPYNEDRTKKSPHIGQGPEPLGRAGQYQIVSQRLRCLGSQIEHEAARIFACEPECRHIGMTNHEPFTRPPRPSPSWIRKIEPRQQP